MKRKRTCGLLGLVASDGTHDGVLGASEAVESTFAVTLSLRRFVLGLPLGLIFLTRVLPRGGTGKIANLKKTFRVSHTVKNAGHTVSSAVPFAEFACALSLLNISNQSP